MVETIPEPRIKTYTQAEANLLVERQAGIFKRGLDSKIDFLFLKGCGEVFRRVDVSIKIKEDEEQEDKKKKKNPPVFNYLLCKMITQRQAQTIIDDKQGEFFPNRVILQYMGKIYGQNLDGNYYECVQRPN